MFGRVSFAQALQHSINSVFCNIGKQLGAQAILEYAKRFGFYDDAAARDAARASARRAASTTDGTLFDPKDATQVDPGRLAFGQERLLVTPLQMAMVAAGSRTAAS